ncbi:MAG: hypothetical protein ABI186_00415 [Candidatus Elarobacter sp.]
MSSTTYTSAEAIDGPTFTCKRCLRVYPYPRDQGAPVRCECGWWYTNLGRGKIAEEFRPRIGGARTSGPEKAADPAPDHH